MDEMSVPSDLEVPNDASDEYRRQVEHVNEYLQWARTSMRRMSDEVERLGQVRGSAVLQNGPNGILLA